MLNFYCEVIEINTIEEGDYTITSNSDTNMVGYVYENDFILLSDLNLNAIRWNVDGHYNNQFRITLHRQMNSSLILIVTTKRELQQDHFSINVYGPREVIMQRIGMFSFSICFYGNC